MKQQKRDYSRAEYAYGSDALQLMQKASFCVLGCQGVGAEIAKCLIMTGCQVSVCDPEPVSFMDLCSNPFFMEQDIGRPRDVVLARLLSDLNPYTTTSQVTISDLSQFSQYQAVIYTHFSLFSTLQVGSYCRSRQIHFIISQTFGLSGRIFTDFGQDFTIYDEFGEKCAHITLYNVEIIHNNPNCELFLYGSNPFQMQKGDLVELTDVQFIIQDKNERRVELESELERILNNRCYRVITAKKSEKVQKFEGFTLQRPHKNEAWLVQLSFGDVSEKLKQFLSNAEQQGLEIGYLRSGYVRQIKESKTIHFRSFEDALKEPTYSEMMSDFVKLLERDIFFEIYKYLDYHPGALQQCTIPWSESQFEHFYEELASNTQVECLRSELAKNIIRKFIGLHMGQFSPVCSVVGGWGAQEALKAVSGVYTPIQQFWLFDCFEVLKTIPTQEDTSPQSCRYDGQIVIFGNKIQEMIHDQSVLLVGAGALGCELTKFLALSGACTQNELTVVDFDRVRNSNLPHQFLFRDSDVGLKKAEVACNKAQSMNPEMKINPILAKLSKDNNSNPELWQNKSIVLSAVDSFESRHVIDSKCIQYHKPLIDSGTSGPKSNMQAVIPHVLQLYSANQDQVDIEANDDEHFYQLQHPNSLNLCVQYSYNEFRYIFETAIEDIIQWQKVSSENEYLEYLNNLINDQSALSSHIYKLIQFTYNRIENDEDCYIFALSQFKKIFQEKAKYDLRKNPLDYKYDGKLFWSKNRRPPKVVHFNEMNEQHMIFVKSTCKLIGDVFDIQFKFDQAKFHQILQQYDELQVFDAYCIPDLLDKRSYKQLLLFIQQYFRFKPKKNIKISTIHYDEENPSHLDYLYSFSNILADNFEIPQADAQEVRRIVSHIIPQLITTTTSITGHVGIEFVKVAQQFDQVGDFKQVFANSAMPMIQLCENEPCSQYGLRSERHFTAWDYIYMTGNITIQDVIDEVLKISGAVVDGIMSGAKAVYMGFMDDPEKKKCRVRDVLKSLNEPSTGEIMLVLMPEGDGDIPNLMLRD